MQVKATKGCLLTPTGMATSRARGSKFWEGCEEKETYPSLVYVNTTLVSNINIEAMLNNPGIPMRAVCQRAIDTPMYIVALSTIAKMCKQPKLLFTDEWIEKMCI